MQNDIYLIGGVGHEITLSSVINQVKETDQSKPLNVHIHSEGGSVYDGVAIYNYFKQLPQEVNTNAVGLVASSASIFFLAGKKRTAFPQNRILIHLPMNIGMGNASDLEATARDLREEEEKIADIYVAETNFTKEEAMAQMKEDKMFTTQQLLDKGFITELKDFKAVANLNNKPNKMSETKITKEQEQGVIAKFLKGLGIGATEKAEVKNVVLKTASQENLDFFEVEEGEPVAGDKATLEGDKPEGDVVLADGRTMNFAEGGILQTISEEEEEEESIQAKYDALISEHEELKTQLSNKVSKTELEAKQAELEKLQSTHSELVNKLEAFTSTETVDTTTKVVKKEVKNNKKTLSETMSEMASNKKQ